MPKTWNADRIKALRSRFNETQEDFARRVGVTFVSVNRWERGKGSPSKLARRALEELEARKVQ